MGDAHGTTRLVVFSDDWGRHPSSCQHLVGRLLPRYPTAWVNTIGTRSPRLSRDDLAKILRKLRQWSQPPQRGEALPANLTVITPRMFPGFRRAWQRRFNAGAMIRALGPWLRETLAHGGDGSEGPQPRTIGITTLPITADLLTMRNQFPVDRWVYYCVDDLAAWPGLDATVLQQMEHEQVAQADAVVAVSEPLRQRMAAMGAKEPQLLTHGIDLAHWARPSQQASRQAKLPLWCQGLTGPIYLFWGLLDKRLDANWCRALCGLDGGTLVLAGPQQALDDQLVDLLGERDGTGIIKPGPVAFDDLPALAAWADVLVMPYADLPVTRAMQPLKFKEYLAADWPHGKPVVVRRLPAVEAWSDAADVVDSAEQLVEVIRLRTAQGLPESQRAARRRLLDESWDRKAIEFEQVVLGTQRIDPPKSDRPGS